MKKSFKVFYIVVFMLICAAPLALMPFAKKNENIEKRELAKFPKYMENGRLNVDFSTEFESWFNDRIPYRSELLTAANYIKGETLHAPTSNAIVGKDGWLFYESEGADYMNTNAMTDAQINAAVITLSLIQENVESKGGHFVFVPMPNKASVYGEYMPGCYTKDRINNLSRIMTRSDEVGVNYVDMQAVMEANKDKTLYHRRDSHWNYQGALIGYNAIMDGLGVEHKTYADATYTVEKNWRADLDKLLYPAGGVMDDQYYYNISYEKFMFTYPAGVKDTQAQLENFMSDKEEGDDLIKTKSRGVKDGSKLYMARDSFGRALLPLMIDNYETAEFKRTDTPDINSIGENTDFVYEIVERNLHRLADKAPFMYAPERDASMAVGSSAGADVKVYCDNEGYGVRLYGAFPDAKVEGDGRVYIQLVGNGGTYVYEAFPIYEKDLMQKQGIEDGSDSGHGFSAILQKVEGLSGKYEVTIVTGGTAYSGGTITVE